MPLDRPTILTAAMDLVDECGLGFTLRSLGDRLGVSQMAPYRHFPDKAAIVDALADELLSRIRLEDPATVPDPDDLIVGYAIRTRTTLLAHPALVPVVAARPLAQDSRLEDLALLHQTFQRAGFPDEAILEAVMSLVATTLGLILYEQQRAAFERNRIERYQEQREATLDQLERADAPDVRKELIRRVADEAWASKNFEETIRDRYEALKRRAGIV